MGFTAEQMQQAKALQSMFQNGGDDRRGFRGGGRGGSRGNSGPSRPMPQMSRPTPADNRYQASRNNPGPAFSGQDARSATGRTGSAHNNHTNTNTATPRTGISGAGIGNLSSTHRMREQPLNFPVHTLATSWDAFFKSTPVETLPDDVGDPGQRAASAKKASSPVKPIVKVVQGKRPLDTFTTSNTLDLSSANKVSAEGSPHTISSSNLQASTAADVARAMPAPKRNADSLATTAKEPTYPTLAVSTGLRRPLPAVDNLTTELTPTFAFAPPMKHVTSNGPADVGSNDDVATKMTPARADLQTLTLARTTTAALPSQEVSQASPGTQVTFPMDWAPLQPTNAASIRRSTWAKPQSDIEALSSERPLRIPPPSPSKSTASSSVYYYQDGPVFDAKATPVLAERQVTGINKMPAAELVDKPRSRAGTISKGHTASIQQHFGNPSRAIPIVDPANGRLVSGPATPSPNKDAIIKPGSISPLSAQATPFVSYSQTVSPKIMGAGAHNSHQAENTQPLSVKQTREAATQPSTTTDPYVGLGAFQNDGSGW